MACPWVRIFADDWSGDCASEFWEEFLMKASRLGQIAKVLWVLWSIWANRNRCLHDSLCASATAIIHSVSKLEQQFLEATPTSPPMYKVTRSCRDGMLLPYACWRSTQTLLFAPVKKKLV
ncbi:Hermansky-Pudlak syndrome 3 [Corchorus olitorius]|uniref:Hermansky-Pudlak syndrome 3 n=1 Tax=Corchorus olitorius TaxID=93759 RepID=A0A1R3K8N1_9ROSI|nr:Hermansky-Pudlak syndrome 3 [Corchorus olitorius]